MTPQPRCPRCGGFLYEEHDDPPFLTCVECGSVYDYEDPDLADEEAA